MTFNEKLQQFKDKIFNLTTKTEITFLDREIDFSNFNYHTFTELNSNEIWRFLYQLEDDKIYAVIPILSKNVTPDEPFIVLSRTFLITNNSNSRVIL